MITRGRKSGWWIGSYLPMALVLLLAWAFYLFGLESKSLWFDELGTLTGSGWGGSWLDAVLKPLTIPATPKPPLSYVVTRLFLTLSDSVFALRLAPVMFATLTIPLVYALGRALFDRRVGLLSAFLLAIAPLQIRYAQEARMYAQLNFLCLLSFYFFWRAIRSTEKRWWLGFAVASVLAIYTHLLASLALAAMALFGLWLLLRSRSRFRFPFRARHFIVAFVAIALLCSPMLPFLGVGLVSEEGLGGDAAQAWNLGALISALRLFSGGNNVGLAAYALLFALAVIVLIVRRSEMAVLVLLWIVLPVLLMQVVPFGHELRIRYFIYNLPIWLLLVAYGLQVSIQAILSRASRFSHPSGSKVTAMVLIAVILFGAISMPSFVSYYAETKQNWRDAIWLVYNLAEPGDKIYVNHEYLQTGVHFYAGQWAGNPNLVTEGNVLVLPRDLSLVQFPLVDDGRNWLVIPYRDRFLPGGELETRIQPYHHLSVPVVLEPARVPDEIEIISPIGFRTVAVVEIVRSEPPSISFQAESLSIAQGNCTWLFWDVERVRGVYLDGEGVVGHDRRHVCPTVATTYELEAILPDGSSVVKTLDIAVSDP